MNPMGLAWIWFAFALGCALAGLALTGKRASNVSSPPKRSRAASTSGQHMLCARCTSPLEPGERFCGACGLSRYASQRPQKLPRRAH